MAIRDLWTTPTLVGGKLKKVRNDQWGKGRRWQVRWRDADQDQRKRNFTTEDAAKAFWAELQLTPAERASRRTVAEQWEPWIASKGGLKPSTIHDYRQQWRIHVEPVWGDRLLSSITHAEVAQWAGELSGSASLKRRCVIVLSGIIRMAIRDGVLSGDPTRDIAAPRQARGEMRCLTMDEVRRLADECAPHQLVVWTLALTGIRWGELCALKPGDLDVERGRLRVARSVSQAGSQLTVTTPKTGRARDVAVPAWLATELGQRSGEWLFQTQSGGRWRHSSWKRIWRAHTDHGKQRSGATERTGLTGVRVHDLRHTYASLAIAAGADVKAVQRQLGHASAAMTLDVYGHLWDRGLDDVADRLARLSEADPSGSPDG